ncbi:hypothetical protein H072_2796 [Dactylellina haptotyla CBS 200.50]|uniref:Eukaryotic translation initiation factor 3 subunit F n=1 Tax=Dactylellina haptotyla (strain CBS 200.50) TaxID=1284197 RepID=S8AJX3_DACHA|nr:hypothetical protein H072_2796 [Dactylellina haptotyla CBS 200.50]
MDRESFIHLTKPATVGAITTSPLQVVVCAQALFAILDHSLRRSPDQERVIGTLLGVRSEDGSEIEIRNCFAVGHNESQEQVEVDMDYHKQMYNLHLKANPKEVLVGWYATSPELNTFSALIQNFYASNGDGTYPYPAVHLTVSSNPGKDITCRTYISSSVGVTPDRAADSCLFVPVPYEIKYAETERNALESLSMGRASLERQVNNIVDIHSLEVGIDELLDLLNRVSFYVSQVVSDDALPSVAIGQTLLNSLSLAPKIEASELEKLFNTHLQDVLLVSYLANTIRTQIDLSNKLASATGITLPAQSQKTDHKRQRERD